jgi:hypothetical protein
MIQNEKKNQPLNGVEKKVKKLDLRQISSYLVGNSRKMYTFSRKKYPIHASG